jgi:outer membrane protein
MCQTTKFLLFLVILCFHVSQREIKGQDADTNNSVGAETTRVRIDLPSAIRQLLSDNLDLQIERIEPKAADALVTQARGQFDPTFSASFNYLDSKKDLTTQEFLTYGGTLAEFNKLNGRAKLFEEKILGFETAIEGKLPFGSSYALRESVQQIENTLIRESTVNLYDPETQFNVSLEWTQPLLRNFGFDAGLATMRVLLKQRDAMRHTLRRNTSLALADLVFAYHDLLALHREVLARKEDVALHEKVLSNRILQQERGLASERQIRRTRYDLLTARQILAESESRALRSQDAFSRLIEGERDLTTPVKRYEPTPDGRALLPATDRQGSLRKALESRADYQQALSEAEGAKVELSFARDQSLPQLDFTATIGSNGLSQRYPDAFNQAFHSGNEEFDGKLRFSYPLFNRSARGLLSEKQKRKAQAILNIKRVEILIAHDIDAAYAGIEVHSRRVNLASSLSETFRNEMKEERIKIERGVAPPDLLIPLQISLSGALVKEWQTRADLAKAVYQLFLAEGSLAKRLGLSFSE